MPVRYLVYSWSLFFVLLVTESCTAPKGKETRAEDPGHSAWSAQSNIYEVNLRQYTAEGTIRAFEKALPRLKDMGVEILWFMPLTPIGLEGRKMSEKDLGSYYAVRDYKGFNAEYGTMADWKAFVIKAHVMGFKVIIDWVPNHSAADNIWIKTHPDFYARDEKGDIIIPNDWTDVRKLNYDNREMRDSMIAAMKFWITDTDIDGFRCDQAGKVPDDFWKACIHQLRQSKNIFMLAEGEKPELITDGFDATYTWTIMHEMEHFYSGKRTLKQFDSLLNYTISLFPDTGYRIYFTSNHDENSWNGTEFEKYGEAYKAFAVFSQTFYQSIPLMYSGQEIPNKKRLKFFVKDTIEWNKGFAMAPFYKTLLKLRKSNSALAAGASYKRLASSNDAAIFAYQRKNGIHKIAVLLNLSNQPQKFTISDVALTGQPLNVFSGAMQKIDAAHEFNIEPWGYIVYDYK